MTINPEAIERFRARQPPFVPAFKGATRDMLDNAIVAATGIEYRPNKPSDRHQIEGTAFALYCRQSLLFFEPRVRKTKIALDWAEHLRRAGLWKGKGLVIAHAAVGVDVWEAEAHKWSRLKVTGIQTDNNPRSSFINALSDDTDLIVIAWGTLQSMFTIKRLNRKDENQFYADVETLNIVSGEFSLAIIDEIHYCMNHDSLRFDIASHLVSHCPWRLGLTGTPVGRNAKVLWAQCFLIDDGATLGYNYHFFERVFGVKRKHTRNKRGYEYVFNQDCLPIILHKLTGIAMSYKLSEIHDINVMSDIIELRMRGDQRQYYNNVIDQFSEREEDREVINTFARLRQISSGFMPYIDEDGTEQITQLLNNPKLEWLQELIELLPDDLPIVIFHEFIRSGQMISDMLTKLKREYVCFNGRTRDRSIINEFQNGHVNTMVANTRSGGESIDLRRAEYLCFYESPCSPIVRKQAESRPLARGERPLLIADLVCSPVEQRILDMIAQGRDLQHAITSIRFVLKDRAK